MKHDSVHRSLTSAADLSRLRKLQLVSFAVAIVFGGLGGGLFGFSLDHAAADGNTVSRWLTPLFGTDPSMTVFTCAYAGIAVGLLMAVMFNRLLQLRAQQAVARVADREMWRLLDDSR